ncbi:MAG: methylenetetrahydrofolate reductase [NAD(P)H], partial [Burkholderiales bacterium]
AQPVAVSFEFFPPNDAAMEQTLWQSVQRLAPLRPRFVSVTYGADGSTRARTHNVVMRVLRETNLTGAPHLTCIGASREEILCIARDYWANGVRHIVALRGDPPGDEIGGRAYEPHPGGYRYAADLVAGLKRVADFEISVAAYPEVHPEARSAEADLDNLKRKLDAGASRAITQYFFDPAVFLRFRDRAAAAGIGAPIVPGILPVTNFAQVIKFSRMCGASVPRWLNELFDGLDEDPETRKLVAAMVATEQCRALRAADVTAFHFYTLNRADLIIGICRRLGLKPAPLAGLKPGLASETPPPSVDLHMP